MRERGRKRRETKKVGEGGRKGEEKGGREENKEGGERERV